MAATQIKTFDDLLDAAAEALKIQSSDLTNRTRLKRIMNSVYAEVCATAKWDWTRGHAELILPVAYAEGTADVEEGNNAVAITDPDDTYGFEGFYFSVDGEQDVYRIIRHSAGDTNVVLETPYQGESNTSASFKIWTDALALPPDASDIIIATTDRSSVPLEGVGLRKFKEIVAANPKCEATVPNTLTVTDFDKPAAYEAISGLPSSLTRASAGRRRTIVFASTVASYLEAQDRIRVYVSAATGGQYNCETVVESVTTSTLTYLAPESYEEAATSSTSVTVELLSSEGETERQRVMLVHPSINTTENRVIKVDFTRNIKPLEDDDDEPVLPTADRKVLLHGTLAEAFGSIVPNAEQQARHERLFNTKLAKMMGRLTESTDFPRLQPSKTYLARKRAGNRRGRSWTWDD